jgi:hypothetical protein
LFACNGVSITQLFCGVFQTIFKFGQICDGFTTLNARGDAANFSVNCVYNRFYWKSCTLRVVNLV